ncbi:MAG TPA: class I SAM-dependent methyltransferase [Chitinophagaceae bacterium]|nr:class I SAM-dependent methyltransferase [Chitinophagaceae bacterium]
MKKFLHYIYNFFYVAFNWNLQLAVFITWHEIKRGPKYNINTIKPESLDTLTIDEGDRSKSSPYEALNYFILENLLENFCKLFPLENSLIDVGSGKGRVMVAAAHYGFKNITGVDFAKELCVAAERNINKIKTQFPHTTFNIYCKDILNYEINADDKVFFLFNPFNKEIMAKFLEKIDWSVKEHQRTIYFIYANPQQIDILIQKNYQEIFRIKKLKRLEGVILLKQGD